MNFHSSRSKRRRHNAALYKTKAKKPVIFIARAAVIAAVYFAFSVAVQAFSFGPVQFRLSEVMSLLPALLPEAVPGLIVGCFFTNFFFSPFGVFDMIFGTLATAVAAFCTYFLRRRLILASIPPMIFNALLVPLIWVLDASGAIYYIAAAEILLSEFIICGVIGVPFTAVLKRSLTSAGLIAAGYGKYRNIPPYYRETPDKTD